MNHTTGAQDTVIDFAESAAQNALDHVRTLIDTITELDAKIDVWVETAGCNDPADLEDKLAAQESRIEELTRQLEEAKEDSGERG